jgi:polyferredoxin
MKEIGRSGDPVIGRTKEDSESATNRQLRLTGGTVVEGTPKRSKGSPDHPISRSSGSCDLGHCARRPIPLTSVLARDGMSLHGSTELFQIQLPPAPPARPRSRPKKTLVRRARRDYSQSLRHAFQFAFLALNAYLGGAFYLWVRGIETGRQGAGITRPAGVEGWLPIAGLMNLKYLLVTGRVPKIHPAAMFLLLAFLCISSLFRKAFCSWLCPIGTLSESLWRVGRRLVGRNYVLPRWLDIPLRGLKYLLLGFFLWAITSMSAEAIAGFMRSPYGLVADVKMLNFFRHLGATAAIVLTILGLASLIVQNFWCRYLCPYGALLGLASLFGPTRVRRDSKACIDCSKCAAACPAALPVDRLLSVQSAECTGCLECIAACPARDALWAGPAAVRSKPRLPAWAVAAGIAVLFLGIIAYARVSGHWAGDISAQVYAGVVPHADQASHPMPGDPALGQ